MFKFFWSKAWLFPPLNYQRWEVLLHFMPAYFLSSTSLRTQAFLPPGHRGNEGEAHTGQHGANYSAQVQSQLSVRSHKTKQIDPRTASWPMNQGEITICGRAKALCVPHQSLKQVIPQTYRSCLTGCFCGSGPNCRSGRAGACQLGIGFKGTISSAISFLRKVTVADFQRCDKLPKAMGLKREKVQFWSVSEFWPMMGPASLGLQQHTCGRACGGALSAHLIAGKWEKWEEASVSRFHTSRLPLNVTKFQQVPRLGPSLCHMGLWRTVISKFHQCQMRQGTGKNGRTLCSLQVAFRETQKVGKTWF